MNTLALLIQSRPDDDGSEVRVLIDGRDLVDLAREVEAPWARADGQPQTAGADSGLWPGAWRHDGLGPFTFERAAYEQAIRDVTVRRSDSAVNDAG
jgi:hypothetical protein